MPRGDRTGPRGMGPMTGRRAGFCAGFSMPGTVSPVAGGGFGTGFAAGRDTWGRGFGGGGGRGWRNMFYATGQPGWARYGGYAAAVGEPDPELEKQALENQANAMQVELDAIRKRLEGMEKEGSGK